MAEYLIRKRAKENDFQEVRVAVVGNVDAGKSTLLGVLTHGELDNGRGLARQRLFRHKHEMESGDGHHIEAYLMLIHLKDGHRVSEMISLASIAKEI